MGIAATGKRLIEFVRDPYRAQRRRYVWRDDEHVAYRLAVVFGPFVAMWTLGLLNALASRPQPAYGVAMVLVLVMFSIPTVRRLIVWLRSDWRTYDPWLIALPLLGWSLAGSIRWIEPNSYLPHVIP